MEQKTLQTASVNCRKFVLAFLFFCSLNNTSQAQMIYLPDTNFRNALVVNGYGGAIYGDSLDAGNSLVINATSLSVAVSGINDLTGIGAFVNLQHLFCNDNNLSFLPQLPANLLSLLCYWNSLAALPQLPPTLLVLNCGHNQLTSLPQLPPNLFRLEGGFNQLTSLPQLPPNLYRLECMHNMLVSLPNLPASLGELDCSTNSIVNALPALPAGLVELKCAQNVLYGLPPSLPSTLQYLDCSNNFLIATIPAVPTGLTHLICDNNQVTSLPSLPDSLITLTCGGNQLTSLPPLPAHLLMLHCEINLLTSLPTLPASLLYLDCWGNINLSCLPELHDLDELYFYNTAISCLPNYANIANCAPLLNTLPLCDMFNNSGCGFYWNISGQTYADGNANCVYDSAEFNFKNIPLQLFNNGNLIQQTTSTFFGKYDFDTDSNGIYEVRIDTTGLPFDIICPAPGLYADTISSTDSLKTNRDFSLQCNSGLHVGIKSIYANRFRPARFTTVNISVEDLALFYGVLCATGENGTVTVRLDGPLTYIGPAPGALSPVTVIGNLLTYNVPGFDTLISGAFNIIAQTDSFVSAGTLVCITVTTITTNISGNIKTDSLQQCFTVVGSFDPNYKEVSPVSNVDMNGDGWLIYTINFQNTGTAVANDIYLLDTLDTNLDWSTFKLTAYSHQPQIQLFNTGLLRFNFPNINLPDSNANEPLSHGYVQYKIKIKPGLSLGTLIYNTAYIYFDFNPPVITNTTQNVLIGSTTIAAIRTETAFSVFPNPVHDVLMISLRNQQPNTLLTIDDLQGRTIMEEHISPTHSTMQLNVNMLLQGIYLLKINGQVQRFVKM